MGLERIDQLKKERGWTNEQLATLSGVPKGTIDKITAGATKDPKLETIKAIARALECNISEFDDNENVIKSPAPAEASTGEISLEESNALLEALGYIKPGEQISDEDLTFLEHVIGLLDAWFDKGH